MGRRHSRGTCQIIECGRPLHAKGYCETHYSRARRGRVMCEVCGVTTTGRFCSAEHRTILQSKVIALAIEEVEAMRVQMAMARDKHAGRMTLLRFILERAA